MNIRLRFVKRWNILGEVDEIYSVYIRGSKIRFIIVPDMFKYAPMFKRIDPQFKQYNKAFGMKNDMISVLFGKHYKYNKGQKAKRYNNDNDNGYNKRNYNQSNSNNQNTYNRGYQRGNYGKYNRNENEHNNQRWRGYGRGNGPSIGPTYRR